MQSSPESYPIADFLKWQRDKQLKLDPDFQRGAVWPRHVQVYLIDSILRGMPIPKVLFRTVIDRHTQQVVRDVVDGQQRLRAIIDFANDDLRLGRRTEEFAGMVYTELPSEYQDKFLSYKLTTEQLINASDEDVIEIFVRMNTYSVALNAQELRNAKYGGPFKSSVLETVSQLSSFWSHSILNPRQRVRMADAQLVAEMFGIVLKGVTDGGQPRIESLYREFDKRFEEQAQAESQIVEVCQFISQKLLQGLEAEHVVSPPNILLLFAAVAHVKFGIPQGQLEEEAMRPPLDPLEDIRLIRENLSVIESVLSNDAPRGTDWTEFWTASKSSTQRIASRKVRFQVYLRALGSEML